MVAGRYGRWHSCDQHQSEGQPAAPLDTENLRSATRRPGELWDFTPPFAEKRALNHGSTDAGNSEITLTVTRGRHGQHTTLVRDDCTESAKVFAIG
jgi:hypothetical protein